MENLYRVVDVKEREERNAASQLQASQKELAIQKEQTNKAVQSNSESLIRLENTNQIITNLEDQNKNLKSELSNWKKITVISVVAVFIILILLLIKLVLI